MLTPLTLGQLVGQTTQGGRRYRRPPFFPTKKLAILGSTKTLEYAPWHDASWTLAAHPCCRPSCQREPDWYFDLHRPACFRTEHKRWNPHYYSWLKTLQTPIFMQEHYPEIPMSVRYPLERILAEFRPHFTNHVAYLIALAMTEGVTHIGLFGCQYSHDTEHSTQRDSCIYWLGRFEQAGGTLVLPPTYNTLLNYPAELYGYASHDEHGKLIPSYRPKKTTVTVQTPKGPERRALTLVEPTDRPVHLDIGMPVAWERSPFTEAAVQ